MARSVVPRLFFLTLLGLPQMALSTPAKGPPGVLVVPTSQLGNVRPLSLRKVRKSVHSALSFSAVVRVLKDTDRVGKEEDARGDNKPRESRLSKRIGDADRARQKGTDLAAAGKHKRAYKMLRKAISIYELAFRELVDFSKLADAYARAAVSAYMAKVGVGDVRLLLHKGLSLQPTLVLDRRRTNKKLLALFDKINETLQRSKRGFLVVKGKAPGAKVFVDGVDIGALPARKNGLVSGLHYVQVRGAGWQPWARSLVVTAAGKTITARAKTVKKARAAKPKRIWTIADIEACGHDGSFVGSRCKMKAMKLAKQTGAEYVFFSALRGDRYDRLTLHTFLMRTRKALTISLKPVRLAKNLGDLNARLSTIEEKVAQSVAKFPRARALRRTPKVFR